MSFTPQDIRLNAEYFAAKLRAECPIAEVAARSTWEAGAKDFVILDVRSREKFARGHIQGALSVPLAELGPLASRLPQDLSYVTYCGSATCPLSAEAALQLAERGYFAREMNAGWVEWQRAGHPTHVAEVAEGEVACACSLGLLARPASRSTAPTPPAAEERSATPEPKDLSHVEPPAATGEIATGPVHAGDTAAPESERSSETPAVTAESGEPEAHEPPTPATKPPDDDGAGAAGQAQARTSRPSSARAAPGSAAKPAERSAGVEGASPPRPRGKAASTERAGYGPGGSAPVPEELSPEERLARLASRKPAPPATGKSAPGAVMTLPSAAVEGEEKPEAPPPA